MKKKANQWKGILAVVMCMMLLCAGVTTASASEEAQREPIAEVYAASDFQPHSAIGDDISAGKLAMQTIIRQMVADGHEISGALFCGDYSKSANTWKRVNVELNNAGVKAIAEVLGDELGLDDGDVIYVQGNHDPAETIGLDASGANDTEHYGVYVLHEDDFQWKQGDDTSSGVSNSGNDDNDAEETTKATAEALKAYLQEKVDARVDQPIFVCAHVPLHYSYRTFSASSQDNIYAKYIFDVLNAYGEQLNIIFLFGHDHSDTYDDYLGGGAIYLPAGDKILIPNVGGGMSFTEYTLNFTYMNAGYVGYYDGKCDGGELTSTVFEIYEDEVVITRYSYDKKGGTAEVCDLKMAGVWDKSHRYKDFTESVNNTAVYAGSQTVTLHQFYDPVETGDVLGAGAALTGMMASLAVCGYTGLFLRRRRLAK